MYCPFCGHEDTKVLDSRLVNETNSIRRRRACAQCHERFSSYESIEMTMPRVIKKDQTRVPFDGNKMREGIDLALQKRRIPSEDIEAVISRLTKKICFCGEKEITTLQIGEWVLQELQKLDTVAYIRFASVYQQFQSAEEFMRLLDQLNATSSTKDARNPESCES